MIRFDVTPGQRDAILFVLGEELSLGTVKLQHHGIKHSVLTIDVDDPVKWFGEIIDAAPVEYRRRLQGVARSIYRVVRAAP